MTKKTYPPYAMRFYVRGVIVLVLLWLEFVLYRQAQSLRNMEMVDGTKVLVFFLSIVAIAIVIGTIVAVTLIPAIGESVGGFLFNPNQAVEKDPHAGAMAKMAQGDYEGAIEEYRQAYENDTSDLHALSEIVHIYCDKLGDVDSGQKVLEEALEKDWPAEQTAFLATRLVDIYWTYKHDAESARHLLNQITETMPDTKHAANAFHRLHEIDRVLMDEEARQHLHSTEGNPEVSGEISPSSDERS